MQDAGQAVRMPCCCSRGWGMGAHISSQQQRCHWSSRVPQWPVMDIPRQCGCLLFKWGAVQIGDVPGIAAVS